MKARGNSPCRSISKPSMRIYSIIISLAATHDGRAVVTNLDRTDDLVWVSQRQIQGPNCRMKITAVYFWQLSNVMDGEGICPQRRPVLMQSLAFVRARMFVPITQVNVILRVASPWLSNKLDKRVVVPLLKEHICILCPNVGMVCMRLQVLFKMFLRGLKSPKLDKKSQLLNFVREIVAELQTQLHRYVLGITRIAESVNPPDWGFFAALLYFFGHGVAGGSVRQKAWGLAAWNILGGLHTGAASSAPPLRDCCIQ